MPQKTASLRLCNGFSLKLIALVTMTIDHVAAVLIRTQFYMPMRSIGRIAFPIYCFLLVEGYFHTHSTRNYLGRLLFVFLLSDIPFDLAFERYWPCRESNVMLTLAIGLLAVCLIDRCRSRLKPQDSSVSHPVLFWLLTVGITLGGMALADFFSTDYHAGGVLLIVLFYLLRDKPVLLLLTVPATLYCFFGTVELPGVIALLPIFLYNGERGPTPGGKVGQWFFYLYYPLHLSIIAAINFVANGAQFLILGQLVG